MKTSNANFQSEQEGKIMIARFHYNIPRHHGKYGTAVSIYESREAMRNGEMWVKYFKTYKYQNPGDGRVCDSEKQIEELKSKVLKQFPNVEFLNL